MIDTGWTTPATTAVPAIGTVRSRHEPDQPGRDAVAVVVPPLGLALGDGPPLGRRLPLGRRRRSSSASTSSAPSGRRSASTATSRTRASRRARRSKALLAILGCMTMQGPVTQWVTDHRKHHALSDKPGDPHSPHVGHGDGALGALRGFVHAHVGWMFSNLGMEQGREYGRDLYEDRLVRTIDRLYLLWVVLTLGIPFAIGYARRRHLAGRRRGPRLGRADPDLPLPARDVQRELDLPHVRAPGLPLARRGAEQLARRAARLRRGLAQQPPRVPGLGPARPRTGARSTSRGGDPRRSSGSASSGT